MFYAVTFFWRSGQRGWTEQYYRESGSARLATDLGGPAGLVSFLALRSPPVELQAIRAEEQGGLGRVYVRELHRPATTRDVTPDVPGVSVRCLLPFHGGSGRNLWIRGVPDSWVRYDAAGRERPAPELVDRLGRLWGRVEALQLRGRRLLQVPWFVGLHSAGAHPSEPSWTRVVYDTPPAVAVGQRVYFGGETGCCPLRRERPYWVTEVTDAWLSLLLPWPAELADVSLRMARLRVLTYEYPLLRPGEFREFSTHLTGPAYRPATWTWTWQRAPMDPCGRVTDYLRQCYATTIRPYRDDPGIALPAAWYWCKPGVPEVPFDHPFGSRAWHLADGQEPLVGEQFARRRTDGGDLTGLDGVGVCGTGEQWGWGASVGDPLRVANPETGQPCCCGPGVRVLAGGGAGGGTMTATPTDVLLWWSAPLVGSHDYGSGTPEQSIIPMPGTAFYGRPFNPLAGLGVSPPSGFVNPGIVFADQAGQFPIVSLTNAAGVLTPLAVPGDLTVFMSFWGGWNAGVLIQKGGWLYRTLSPNVPAFGHDDTHLRWAFQGGVSSWAETLGQGNPGGIYYMRRSGATVQLYKDGQLKATGSGFGEWRATHFSASRQTPLQASWAYLYDLMVYPRSLSDDEVSLVLEGLAARMQ